MSPVVDIPRSPHSITKITAVDPPPHPPTGAKPEGFEVQEQLGHRHNYPIADLEAAIAIWVKQGTARCALYAVATEDAPEGRVAYLAVWMGDCWGPWVCQ